MSLNRLAAPGFERTWDVARADALGAIARTADALIERCGATPLVVAAVGGERKRYGKNQLLRRRITVSVEEQALAAKLFFVVDAHIALLAVVPEFKARLESILASARRSPDAVAAWRLLSPSSLEDELAPPFLRSSPLGTPLAPATRFHYRRDPFAAMQTSIHGRAEEQIQRLPPQFVNAVEHRGDGATLENVFFEAFERVAIGNAFPFGLAIGVERDRFIRAVVLGQEAETAGTLDWAVTDLGTARDPAAAFRAGFAQLSSGQSSQKFRSQPVTHRYDTPKVDEDDDNNDSELVSMSAHARTLGSFDMVRLAAAVQLRWCRDHPDDLPSGSGWHAQLERAAFPCPTGRPNTTEWSRVLLDLAPYSAAMATGLNELWPAGSVGALAAAARDFRVTEFEPGRRDEVIAAARPAALDKYWRQRFAAEQLGRNDPAMNWTPINTALTSLLRLEISDLYQDLNKRPIEVALPGHDIRLGEDEIDLEPWVSASPDNTGGATVDPFSHRIRSPGSDLNYERPPGESSQKGTPIPWIDEFLEYTVAYVSLWKRQQGIPLGRSDAESLHVLEEFLRWLEGEVDTHEVQALESARLVGGGVLAAEFQPLEITFWHESQTYPGGLAAGLNAWTKSVGTFTPNEQENRRTRVIKLLQRIYSDLRKEYAPDVYWSPGDLPAGILDDLPADLLSTLRPVSDGRLSP